MNEETVLVVGGRPVPHRQPKKYSGTSKYTPLGNLIEKDDRSSTLDLPLMSRKDSRNKAGRTRSDETKLTKPSISTRVAARKRRARSK